MAVESLEELRDIWKIIGGFQPLQLAKHRGEGFVVHLQYTARKLLQPWVIVLEQGRLAEICAPIPNAFVWTETCLAPGGRLGDMNQCQFVKSGPVDRFSDLVSSYPLVLRLKGGIVLPDLMEISGLMPNQQLMVNVVYLVQHRRFGGVIGPCEAVYQSAYVWPCRNAEERQKYPCRVVWV